MGLSFTVGGTRGTFEEGFAQEVACVLDNAFGAEGDWEGAAPRQFGELGDTGWADLQQQAVQVMDRDALPNLLALGAEGRGVYLPTHVQAVALPLPKGESLRCASLPGLRRELAELAERWELPLDDDALRDLINVGQDPDDGWVAEAPEVLTFARLVLAANEAVRRDCPLWLLG
ncbi:MAG: hypothetical protein P4L84_29150 [Isosphaeraceae bacterium]|nr:hypothetical protein [Isosphaeraceae bacterium]